MRRTDAAVMWRMEIIFTFGPIKATFVYQVETYFDAVTGDELASQSYSGTGDMAVIS